MRKHTFWESLLGLAKPKTFIQKTKSQLQGYVLIYLQNYGRENWKSTANIAEWLLFTQKGYDFNKKDIQNWFASGGMKGEISNSTHRLRILGHPVIAGTGRKGYRYADENCDDLVEVWEEKLRAWSKREDDWDKERKIDIKLIDEVLKKLKEPQKRKQLIKIKQKYSQEKRSEEGEEKEE